MKESPVPKDHSWILEDSKEVVGEKKQKKMVGDTLHMDFPVFLDMASFLKSYHWSLHLFIHHQSFSSLTDSMELRYKSQVRSPA